MLTNGVAMDSDLKPFLDSWPYDPDDCVRVITLADGREVLQVRLPLGIEQYELDGRPDGSRPHDADSVLDHYCARLEDAKKAGSEPGSASIPMTASSCSTKACCTTIATCTCSNSRTGPARSATRCAT